MCWKCLNDITIDEPVSRSAECPVCGADLHSCKNCTFYDTGSHYDCHETVDELIQDKEKANFCDYFKIKRNFNKNGGLSDVKKKAEDARKAFDALFSI